MAIRSKMFRGILQRLSSERYAPFRGNTTICDQTFVRVGPKKILTLVEEHVVAVARQLEATLVMGELLEDEQHVSIDVTHIELMHFVAYVRQLDAAYRKQVRTLTKQAERIAELEYRYENKVKP